ncbi:unnamed protein product [Mytilus edulis]|uniref:Reverse transcriptase domain-containing protein n=1 Tax=Mytilus edulis TaxID=6550 RepID=A0A8S3V5W9_MYTED|nr:unnamed protein product [Mytilus edulis]
MGSCLLYADDLVIMSDSADGLESQLDSLHKWTNDHLMTVNYDKSKVMHIRKTTVNQCGHTFMFGDKALELTSKYRYLGLVICEHTDFTTTTHELLTAGSRALGSLTSKYYNMGNMDYDTYTKIYDSTVSPILEYASAVWGFKKYNPLERLQYRAIRTFLGVGKHAPLPAITGDTGWTPIHMKTQCNMIKLWCKLCEIPEYRLCRKTFMWDLNISNRYKRTWSNDVKTIMTKCGLQDVYFNQNSERRPTAHIVSCVKNKLVELHQQEWLNALEDMPKLRTYKNIKTDYNVEPYLKKCLSRQQRSVIARMRSGTLHLEIEKGRFRNVPLDQRLCKMCKSQSIEDESHLLLFCERYEQLRTTLFNDIRDKYNIDLTTLPANIKLKHLFCNYSKLVSNFILNCFTISQSVINC